MNSNSRGAGGTASPLQKNPIHSPADLIAAGLAEARSQPMLEKIATQFAIAVTPAIASLIDPHDPDDPIARQFVPSAAEMIVAPHERADPIGDQIHSPLPGLIHRYPDRVLLKTVAVCPVYCRFCFRREAIGPGSGALTEAQLAACLDYIRAHPAVWEVVLSGGDPLILSARRLGALMTALAAIDHVKIIRLHSRVPVVDPDRLDGALVAALKTSKAATWVLLHANHAREFTPAALAAISRLVDAGIPVLGQSVLLKGVNDSVAALSDLFRAMVAARVKPHYLHHLDPARGTHHFRVSLATGRALVRALRGSLSGLCQPSYMLDIPGGHGKVPVGPDHLEQSATPGHYHLRDRHNQLHDYQDEIT